MRWLFLMAALAGCHRGDEALRYERGDGVPRDYSRAAQIYAQRCRHGDGDVAACRAVILARLRHRGDATMNFDARAVMQRACDRGDWASCMPPLAAADRAKARAACEAGTPAACVAAVAVDAFSQSGTVEAQDHERLVRACRADYVEACIDLTGPGREPLDAELAEHLHRACTAGDADACAAAGTPIAPAELCRAHDFEACAAAGSTGGPELERACESGVADACRDLAVRARDADPPDPNVATRFARACAVGAVIDGHDACEQNVPADLAIGCAAYLPVRVPADRRVHLPPLHGTDARPALLFSARDVSPATYGDVARRLGTAVAVYVYAAPGTDPSPYAPAMPIALDPALATVRIATGAESTGSALATTLGDQWPIVVDATRAARAMLSFQHGLAPATLARCVRGLLAEP